MIDLYCERIGPGLFAEPLNASTNVLFVIAAWWCRRLARESARHDVMVLAGTMFAIGIGSGLFHTFAAPWAELLDVVPLLFFQLAYLWLHLRRVAMLERIPAAAVLCGFAAAIGLCAMYPETLNGSLAYAPAAAALIIISARQYLASGPGARALIAAGAIFVVSLAARTLDNLLCPQWPWGTHFIWHSLNALVLFVIVRAYAASGPARSAVTQTRHEI
jgi:hypothetical protein